MNWLSGYDGCLFQSSDWATGLESRVLGRIRGWGVALVIVSQEMKREMVLMRVGSVFGD